MSFKKVCRTCLSKKGKISVFTNVTNICDESSCISISEMIYKCISLQVLNLIDYLFI